MEHLSFELGNENGIVIHIYQSIEIFSVSHDVFQPSYLYQWEYICKPHQLSTLDLNSTMLNLNFCTLHTDISMAIPIYANTIHQNIATGYCT